MPHHHSVPLAGRPPMYHARLYSAAGTAPPCESDRPTHPSKRSFSPSSPSSRGADHQDSTLPYTTLCGKLQTWTSCQNPVKENSASFPTNLPISCQRHELMTRSLPFTWPSTGQSSPSQMTSPQMMSGGE
eukprot:3250666-Rhodomonas_salina.2